MAAGFAASVLVVAVFRFVDPPTSAFMLHAESTPVRQRWVDWEAISPWAALAVVAAEDQKFPSHMGFDLASIGDALDATRRGSRLRGASTLSQQVAKNLFLWPGRSWVRKAVEAYLTVWIELLWPKRRILEVYLNLAQFGPHLFGVAVAAEDYFGVDASALTAAEAATLAAVLPDPNRLHADAPSGYVRERRDWILEQMRRLGGTAYLAGLDA